jgi:hypothetical protein
MMNRKPQVTFEMLTLLESIACLAKKVVEIDPEGPLAAHRKIEIAIEAVGKTERDIDPEPKSLNLAWLH